MTRYIFRLDDITSTMNWKRFHELQHLFGQYNVPVILGVIPDNKDSTLIVQKPRENFWEEIKALQKQGWIIAQHGYQHVHRTQFGGILNIQSKSEFAGRSYQEQKTDIEAGKRILEAKLKQPITWWMAPAHSFDSVTCRILRELRFTHITDGLALFPYTQLGLTWVPSQLWHPQPMPFGVWTVSLHPNTMTETDILDLNRFLTKHAKECTVSPPITRPIFLSYPFAIGWRAALKVYQWRQYIQAKVRESFHYTDPAAYDRRAEDPIEQYIHSLWHPFLQNRIADYVHSNTVVCDLGCGTFEHTQYMGQAKHIYAVDSNKNMLDHGAFKIRSFQHKVSVWHESALQTSISDTTCDVVWSVGLSEFVNLDDLFRETNRIVKPNGHILVQFPNMLHPYNLLLVVAAKLLGIRTKKYRTIFEWKKVAERHRWYILDMTSQGIFFYTPRSIATSLIRLWKVFDRLYKPMQSLFPIGNNIFLVLRKKSSREYPPAQGAKRPHR